MKNYKQQLQTALQKNINPTQIRQIFNEFDQYQVIIQVLVDAKTEKASITKEQIKLFGLLAECVNDNLSPFISMIFAYLLKRLKDFDTSMSIQVAETMGKIVKHSCTDGETLQNILKPLMNHLQQNSTHALCLTRVVQFLHYEILEENALLLLRKFISLLSQQNGKVEILEGMAAIILSVEEQSEVFAEEVIPHLSQLLQNQQWQVKKMALDILYSLVVLEKEKIQQYPQFKEMMFELKSNKVLYPLYQIKQIRDSANLILDVLSKDTQKLPSQLQISASQPVLMQQVSITQLPQTPLTPSHQQSNRFSQTPKTSQVIPIKKTTDEKLSLAIEAISVLTNLLRSRGVCDSNELQQVDSILDKLNDKDDRQTQPMKFSQFSDTETFISKEAAEILREFKEKQKQEHLRQ